MGKKIPKCIHRGPITTVASMSEAKWLAFHQANPWVYEKLVELARDLVGHGHRKIGINMLTEVVRWHVLMNTSDPDPQSNFKINNNYAPHYARLIMKQEPDLDGIFETRELSAA